METVPGSEDIGPAHYDSDGQPNKAGDGHRRAKRTATHERSGQPPTSEADAAIAELRPAHPGS
jgi:hypothetical protein